MPAGLRTGSLQSQAAVRKINGIKMPAVRREGTAGIGASQQLLAANASRTRG